MTGPPESDSAPPAEVAEGEESPAAAQASSSQSAEALSGAGPASELPGVHSQASQAAPAKHVGQDSSEAERTAPPAAAEAASTSTPPAGKPPTLGHAHAAMRLMYYVSPVGSFSLHAARSVLACSLRQICPRHMHLHWLSCHHCARGWQLGSHASTCCWDTA